MGAFGSKPPPLGYGLVGCGAFGRFCLRQYRAMPEVRLVAVADSDPQRAVDLAAEFDIEACRTPGELFSRADVQLVHIATPPFTHHALAMQALAAGKHVLCEKPLATRLDHARELVDEARRASRVLAVNLVMPYNPLCMAVKRIADEEILGRPLHAFFENYAKDEPLPPGHWFWDREKSGGIFVEHGVHFFDLYEWWLGPGRVLCAHEVTRPGADFVERSPAPPCTARTCSCTSITASARRKGWTGRSSGSSSSGEACACTTGSPRGSRWMR